MSGPTGADPDPLTGPALLAAALRIAATAHAGATDQAGEPYLGHPLRVAARLTSHGPEAVAAGLLHDVVEDSEFSPEDLLACGIPLTVVEVVDRLTKRSGETYPEAVRRAAGHPLAAVVKAADVADNGDPDRLARLDDDLRRRLEEKYRRARGILAVEAGL